jgi:hypothetical protein
MHAIRSRIALVGGIAGGLPFRRLKLTGAEKRLFDRVSSCVGGHFGLPLGAHTPFAELGHIHLPNQTCSEVSTLSCIALAFVTVATEIGVGRARLSPHHSRAAAYTCRKDND